MRQTVVGLVLFAAACSPDPKQQAREDAVAVAAVNAAQNRVPPPKALRLEHLNPDAFARMDDAGASCAIFVDTPPGSQVLMVARPGYGWIQIDSELRRLISDSGSMAGPLGTRSHYTGKDLTVRIEPHAEDRPVSGESYQNLPVQLVVRDQWDRVVFTAAGKQHCTAQ